MNTECVKEGYTYAEGEVLPTFTNGSENVHPEELCDLVAECLHELPGDRMDCAELWIWIRRHILETDSRSDVALKYRLPDPMDQEVLMFREDLYLSFTKRAGDS